MGRSAARRGWFRASRPALIYVIWSHEHHQWWKPNAMGYTPDLALAGRYTREKAYKPVLNDVKNDEIAIPLSTAQQRGPPKFHPYDGEQVIPPHLTMENQHG